MTSLYVLCMLCLVRGQAPLSTVIPQARILAGASHRAVLKRIFRTQRLYPGLLHSDGFFTIWSTREAVNTEVGSLSLLQGIFPTQELNWGLLHCRWILNQLSYQGSPSTCVNKIISSEILFSTAIKTYSFFSF